MASRKFRMYDGTEVVGEGIEFAHGQAVVQWDTGGLLLTTIDSLRQHPLAVVVYEESQFLVDLREDLKDPAFRKQFVLESVKAYVDLCGDAIEFEQGMREAAYMEAIADYGHGEADGHAGSIMVPADRAVLPADSTSTEISLEMALYGDAYVDAQPEPLAPWEQELLDAPTPPALDLPAGPPTTMEDVEDAMTRPWPMIGPPRRFPPTGSAEWNATGGALIEDSDD